MIPSNILSKSFGNLQLRKADYMGGILMKLGDKNIISTSGDRIGSVEISIFTKHLHISDGICILHIQMVSMN